MIRLEQVYPLPPLPAILPSPRTVEASCIPRRQVSRVTCHPWKIIFRATNGRSKVSRRSLRAHCPRPAPGPCLRTTTTQAKWRHRLKITLPDRPLLDRQVTMRSLRRDCPPPRIVSRPSSFSASSTRSGFIPRRMPGGSTCHPCSTLLPHSTTPS